MIKSTKTYSEYDIVTEVTQDVIAAHLRVTYADEAELPLYCAAAWSAVEEFIGDNMTAGTITFESTAPCSFFRLPISAERIDTVSIEVWDGTAWNTLAADNVFNATIGYPADFRIDTTDPNYTIGTIDESFARMRGTVTYTAVTPTNSMKQAFLLKLGDLYENRQDVVMGLNMTKHPRGFEALLATSVKYDIYA